MYVDSGVMNGTPFDVTVTHSSPSLPFCEKNINPLKPSGTYIASYLNNL
jgi:hypothetical protein